MIRLNNFKKFFYLMSVVIFLCIIYLPIYIDKDTSILTDTGTSEITDFTKYSLVDRELFAKLNKLQNPPNCLDSNLHIYDANVWSCGFGCKLHMHIYQLHIAMYTNRTLIVRNSPFLKNLKAYGINCPPNVAEQSITSLNITNRTIVNVNNSVEFLKTREHQLKYLPISAKKYEKTHKEPLALLVGQFVSYILQYNDSFKKKAAETAKQIGFMFDSCVGVHIRRTDKIREAKYYNLTEYMKHVDLYFERHPNKPKCVYLMSDEKNITVEAKSK